MTISLKTQNVAPLGALVLACLLLAVGVSYGSSGLLQLENLLTALGGSVVVTVLAVWASYLLPANWKAMLVFTRVRDVLPAHRLLELCEEDPRIDPTHLHAVFPNLQSELTSKNQNAVWYREIYRPVSETTEVATVHKAFLLYRDAASVLLLLTLVTASLTLLQIPILDITLTPVIVGCFLIECMLIIVAARNTGNRFVTTSVCRRLEMEDSNGLG